MEDIPSCYLRVLNIEGKIPDPLFKYTKANCMCIFGSSSVYICKSDVDS